MTKHLFQKYLPLIFAFGAALHAGEVTKPEEGVDLVRDGRAVGVVVVGRGSDPLYRKLAEAFVETVERSTAARLPILTDDQLRDLEPGKAILSIGPTEGAYKAGLRAEGLGEEQYRIQTTDNVVFVVGKDALDFAPPEAATRWRRAVEVEPTRWGLNKLLEEQLGVRWLWPGRIGTYVPKRQDFHVPKMDFSYQPQLQVRRPGLGVPGQRVDFDSKPALKQVFVEAYDWLANHQGNYRGKRADLPFAHAYNKWWTKYGGEHPEWFVEKLPGQPFSEQPFHRKLRFTNPEVIEQIAKEYVEAGAPNYWGVSENDGAGFDTSDEARALDLPQNQSIDAIWNSQGNLTARYVTFWNRIYDRLKVINPEVKLVSLAYSCYRQPPPEERPLHAKMVIGMVCSYRSYDEWTAWRSASGGGDMILRPNWGWVGANAPHLPLGQLHGFLQFASNHGMIGFSMDSILGYWGTQGPNYYLMARMMTRPDLSKEEILGEYSSAFGAGAGKVRAYLDYFEKRADEYGYSISRNVVEDGKYHQLSESGKIDPKNWFLGPRQAMIYLYTDEVLAPAYQLLADADEAIGNSDSEATQRVLFLRNGLDEMRATRDLLVFAEKVRKEPTPENLKRFAQEARALETFRETITPTHAIWGSQITALEDRRRLPIRPRNMKLAHLYDGEDW